ncbi:hypothetical protein MKX03_021979 [Papaver bracteatum]|nr:hypothetical protein MKX03_021979 [Papaver bracteatum]
MRIAVEGCMHGDLDNVYATLLHSEKVENTKIDLLICYGDFQAVRNDKDLESINVKSEYRRMNSFWKYYSGQEVAPFPTIFIGGNHEASNYLWELYYGGWAAPNIYFLGFAGVIKFGNLRIGGLSGIYKAHHYHLGHYYDVYKLMQVEEPIDIFLSHDWPVGITDYGDWQQLVCFKPQKLKPPYWFSAHLHCKFAASVQHGENGPVTKFLALDKCVPGRKFLQIVSEPGPHEIQYDEEWLAITRKFNPIFPLTRNTAWLRSVQLDKQDREWVKSKLATRGPKPFDFVQTVPPYNPNQPRSRGSFLEQSRNPQTLSLMQLLELPYLLDAAAESKHSPMPYSSKHIDEAASDGDESDDDTPDDVDEIKLPEGDVDS